MKKVIVILGPTGVGKTKLSISIAKKYHGEIINADSMQIYRNLNIGTAKITKEEKENIPHHLFDIKDVSEDYSIFDYQKDSRQLIEEIWNRGNIPILVGGTGLYIKASLYDYQLSKEKNNYNYDNKTTEELYQELIKLDKNIKLDSHNRRRIVRALDYYKENNHSISDNKTNKLLYDTIFIGLTTDRKNLYNIINNRVDSMINKGLIEEVKYYYNKNIHTKPLLGGIGYKELYKYFSNEITFDQAIELIKKNSRHYAKRQYTFFNHQLPVIWFNTDYHNFNNTIEEISSTIDRFLSN